MFPPKKGEMKLASLRILRSFHLDSPWHHVTALRRPGKTVEEVCSTLGEDYWWWRWCRIQIPSTSSIKSGQIIATSAEVTPNGDALNSGLGIIVIWLDQVNQTFKKEILFLIR